MKWNSFILFSVTCHDNCLGDEGLHLETHGGQKQNDLTFADDNFQLIFMNEIILISIQI